MEITPEHPVYVEDKGWVLAENLTIGDRLRRADGGWARVLAVERVRLDRPAVVYNFTVKGIHTYFVLEVGVLVHNCADSNKWPYTRTDRNGFGFVTDLDLNDPAVYQEIAERQEYVSNKVRSFLTIGNNPRGKLLPPWPRGSLLNKCVECSNALHKGFGDTVYRFNDQTLGVPAGTHPHNVDVYVDGKRVADNGVHRVAISAGNVVWDPTTNTWGELFENYKTRVTYKIRK